MRSGNPVLGENTFLDIGSGTVVGGRSEAMTLSGTVNKSAMLLVLIVWLIPQASAKSLAWALAHTGYRIRLHHRDRLPSEGGEAYTPIGKRA